MNTDESGELLGTMAAFDQRTTGDADLLAWAAAMTTAQVTLPEAQQAAVEFYTQVEGRRAMPMDLIRRVKDTRRARLTAAGPPDFPPNLSWTEEQRWLLAFQKAAKDGHDDPRGAADALLGATRPELSAPQPGAVLGLLQLPRGTDR